MSDQQSTLRAMARGMLRAYDRRWLDQQQQIELLAVEKFLDAPLYNLETSRPSRTFRLAGKIDKLARQNGAMVLYDHKTTSSDIADPNSTYWRQLQIERQPAQYEILLLANGYRIDRIVWDVVRKPQIRPKKLSKADAAVVQTTGTYCGQQLSEAAIEFVEREGSEHDELFEARVFADCCAEPDRYFARRSVVRTREGLAEFADQLWDIAKDIQAAHLSGRNYQNSAACMNYGTPCEFLGICSGYDSVNSDRWTVRPTVHPELPIMEGDGRNLLSNSRIGCFQTCRRKHHYKYSLGLERVQEEEREALWFGSLWSSMLDDYWISSCKKVAENGYCITPANAAGIDSSSAESAELAF